MIERCTRSMDFKMTPEQKEYRQAIIDFAQKELNDSDYLEKFSWNMWKKISNFGLLGITVDEEYGGLGESYTTAAIALEALGYGCKNNGFIFVVNNHIWVSQNLIAMYGSKVLKDKYLPIMVRGESIGAIAITEANSGSDSFSMRCTAVEDGDYYVLNGSKMFISNGPIAGVFVVFAVTQTEPVKKITAFVIDKNIDGVICGEDIKKMGLNACPTCEVVLQNCRVPKENILGKLNQGSIILTSALELERCYEFAPHVGVMQRIMERCIEQAKSRKQFGQAIENYQAVSHKISEMRISLDLSRLMLYKIGWLRDSRKSSFMETSIFKVYVSENYIKTCRDAMQLFGAYGYTSEYEIERELRDALACSIYSGTNEMQKNTIYLMQKNAKVGEI